VVRVAQRLGGLSSLFGDLEDVESLGPYQQNTEFAVGGCGADIGHNAGAPAVGSDTVEAFRLGSLVAPPIWEGFDFVLSHLNGVYPPAGLKSRL
jgi:hypothetical protein